MYLNTSFIFEGSRGQLDKKASGEMIPGNHFKYNAYSMHNASRTYFMARFL